MKPTRELTLRGHDNQAVHTWIGENQHIELHQGTPEVHKELAKLNIYLNLFQKAKGYKQLPSLVMDQGLRLYVPSQGWNINGEEITSKEVTLPAKTTNLPIGWYNGSVIHFDISIKPFTEEAYHFFEDFGEEKHDFVMGNTASSNPYAQRFEEEHGEVVYVQFPTNKNKSFEAAFSVQTTVRTVKFLSDEINKVTTKGLETLCRQATKNQSKELVWYREPIANLPVHLKHQNEAYKSLVQNRILPR